MRHIDFRFLCSFLIRTVFFASKLDLPSPSYDLSMNPHQDCLLPVCRLCGFHRALPEDRHPVPKEQYKSLIETGLSVCVEADVRGIHPPYICKICVVKLQKWKANHSKRKKAVLNIHVFEFSKSECEQCCAVKVTLEDHCAKARQFPLMVWQGPDRMRVLKIDEMGCPIVFLTILANFSWQLDVDGIACENDHVLCQGFPEHFTEQDTFVMCSRIHGLNVCPGNADFDELVASKRGDEGQTPVRITEFDVFVNGTIRHKKCLLMIASSEKRCSVCKIHRGDLSSALGRLRGKQHRSGSATSNAPNASLSRQQLEEKVVGLQTERRSLLRKRATLEARISSMLQEESLTLTPIQEEGMTATFNSSEEEISALLVEDSPARLLWEQQKKSALSGKQMRWHPAVIRWCIAVQSKSASAYNLMRQAGFLRLPHPSTLHSYTHFAAPTTGFNAAMLKRIVDDQSIRSSPDSEDNNVVLLFDEMKVKAGLVYSVRSGRIVGFTDVGEISNEINRFERRCRGEEEAQIATHVLVVMVRGLDSSLHAPVAVYPTTGVTAEQLYPCLWECVNMAETAGMTVRGFVSDGASSNRKFYRLHEAKKQEGGTTSITYATKSHINPSRKVFFICDVPHLMKTTRNNFENSGYNNCTRKLFYNKQDIKWTHLLDLYDWDVGLERSSPGLRKLHKVTYEHLHLSPTLRMRVYLAAQVLSSTVANALEMYGRTGTASTVKFIRMFDQFFDCLNVSNLHQAQRTRKPALAPYTSPDDWRFDWLMKDFLGFLSEWENEVKELPNVNSAVRKKMCLSSETLEGLRITVYSFVELFKDLLNTTSMRFLLSEKLNQDPLEEYFSKQRSTGGASDNPTVEQFTHNVLALHVAAGSVRASKRGNVRNKERQEEGNILDATPLPRR